MRALINLAELFTGKFKYVWPFFILNSFDVGWPITPPAKIVIIRMVNIVLILMCFMFKVAG
jgi:hypothetical protein